MSAALVAETDWRHSSGSYQRRYPIRLQVGNEKKEQHMLYTFLNEEKVSFNEYIEVMNTGRKR